MFSYSTIFYLAKKTGKLENSVQRSASRKFIEFNEFNKLVDCDFIKTLLLYNNIVIEYFTKYTHKRASAMRLEKNQQ